MPHTAELPTSTCLNVMGSALGGSGRRFIATAKGFVPAMGGELPSTEALIAGEAIGAD
jgi:hypothetical protein